MQVQLTDTEGWATMQRVPNQSWLYILFSPYNSNNICTESISYTLMLVVCGFQKYPGTDKQKVLDELWSCLACYATQFYGFLLYVSQRPVLKAFLFHVESFIHDSVNKTTEKHCMPGLRFGFCILVVSSQLCWTQFSLYFKSLVHGKGCEVDFALIRIGEKGSC